MEQVQTKALGKREMNRQDRRMAILEVAGRTFLTNGYAATTMSGIAQALGGSKGTLWSYFRSKEELFEAVLDQVTTEYRAQLSTMLDPCGDLLSTLERFGMSYIRKVTSEEAIALHRLIQAEGERFPELGAIFYERATRQTQSLLADFLSGAMDRGLMRRDDPYYAARVLAALCTSGVHQRKLLGHRVATEETAIVKDVSRAIEVFLRAYAPDPQTAP